MPYLRRADLESGVCVIELDRPPVNSLDAHVWDELAALVAALEEDADVRAVVFASAHPKIYAAGADLKGLMASPITRASTQDRVDRAQSALLKLQRLSKPTIAAIEGHALGGGCELALAMDIRFMTDGGATIGLPEATLGLLPGAGGTQRLPRLVGRAVATRMLMLGQRLSAREANQVGLVIAVDNARTAALGDAAQLAAMPRISMRWIKHCLNEGYDALLPTGLAVERFSAPEVFTSHEAAEGISAFLEKRSPRYHGS
jgi:enoyl-CoA hydratase/carnithine racemase